MNQLYLFTIVGYSYLNLSTSPNVRAEFVILNFSFNVLKDLLGSYLSTWNSNAILAKHNSNYNIILFTLECQSLKINGCL